MTATMLRAATILTCVLVSLAGIDSVAAVDVVQAIEGRLERHPITVGKFVQTARVAVLNQPVVSAGEFFVDQAAGFVWRVESPIEAEFSAGAHRSDAPNASSTPLKWIASIIDRILAGDIDALNAMFEIDGSNDRPLWHLTLTPRARAMRGVIERIEVSGAAAIDSVRILQSNGDSIEIAFHDVTHPPSLPADVVDTLAHAP